MQGPAGCPRLQLPDLPWRTAAAPAGLVWFPLLPTVELGSAERGDRWWVWRRRSGGWRQSARRRWSDRRWCVGWRRSQESGSARAGDEGYAPFCLEGRGGGALAAG